MVDEYFIDFFGFCCKTLESLAIERNIRVRLNLSAHVGLLLQLVLEFLLELSMVEHVRVHALCKLLLFHVLLVCSSLCSGGSHGVSRSLACGTIIDPARLITARTTRNFGPRRSRQCDGIVGGNPCSVIFFSSSTHARGFAITVRAATLLTATVVACDHTGTSSTLAFRSWLFGPTLFVTPSALFDFGSGRANEVFSTIGSFPASLFLWRGVADPARTPTTFGTAAYFATAH